MKKRVLTVVLAAIIAGISALALCGCGSGVSKAPDDTFFQGRLSATTYTSSDSAVRGFLSTEVGGDATKPQFVMYVKSGDLDEKAIAKLDLSEAQRESIVAAESGKVAYSVSTGAVNASAAAVASGNKIANVYVLEFADGFRYYAPKLSSGEVLTKSYYDQVMDDAKYANCTANANLTMKYTVTAQGQRMNFSMTSNQSVKLADEKLYGKGKTTVTIPGVGSNTATTEMYYTKSGNSYVGYMRTNGDTWQNAGSISDLDDVGVNFSGEEADHTYYIKTASGFKLNSEKYKAYVDNIMDEIIKGAASGSGISASQIDMNSLDVSAEFFVEDGYIVKQVVTVKMTMTIQGYTANATLTMTNTFSNFGTTVVETPSDLY